METTTYSGLTNEQARRIRAQGGGNAPPAPITKGTGQIVREHVCTLFNLFNVLIAAALALVGAWSNLLFLLIIVLNTLIGIAQEVHAKRLVEQIAVLTAPNGPGPADGAWRTLPVEELVMGDAVALESGMQIPADARLLTGGVETDESLLTGESTPVRKEPGARLLSGSVVTAGRCTAGVEQVGADSYATRLTQQARAAAPACSELLSSMRRVTRLTCALIPPLGALLFYQARFLQGMPLFGAVTTTAAGLLGMLPKGLVLLISVSLAVGGGPAGPGPGTGAEPVFSGKPGPCGRAVPGQNRHADPRTDACRAGHPALGAPAPPPGGADGGLPGQQWGQQRHLPGAADVFPPNETAT